MTITLTEGEQAVAHLIANQRQSNNRASGVKNKQVSPKKPIEIDLEGVSGELAFARLANVYPDLDTRIRSGSTDCTAYNGKRIDVKTTPYKTGRLMAPTWDKGEADIFVLMIGKFPTYKFAGWAYSKDILKEENIRDLGRGEAYVLEQENLRTDLSGLQNS